MSGTHSQFSPSSLKRTATCPASLKHNHDKSSASFFSAEGTAAHEVAGETLLKQYVHTPLIEADGFEIPVDQEMLDYVQDYIVYCRGPSIGLDTNDFIEWVETRVCISHITPVENQSGTCDHALLILSERTIYITDLKYGKGVQVEAEDNLQLAAYAEGFIEQEAWLYDIDNVVMRIFQPRRNHVSEWRLTRQQLREFIAPYTERLKLALLPNPPYQPSEEACKFCEYKVACPALANKVEMELAKEFEDIDNAEELELVEFFESIPLIRLRIEAAHDYLEAKALQGTPITGTKLVRGRSTRKLGEESEVVEVLCDAGLSIDSIYNKSLKGIGDLEKLLGKNKTVLAACTTKPPGKPVLVLATDPRDAVIIMSEQNMFEDD